MPEIPRGPEYTTADPEMEFRIFRIGMPPGRAKLKTLRQLSEAIEKGLDSRVKALETSQTGQDRAISTLQSAANAEADTRARADAAMGQMTASMVNEEAATRASAVAAETKARSDAVKALDAKIQAVKGEMVPLYGSLVLPAGISILSGKSTRTVNVAGIKRNDNLVITPNAALPANISMGEAYSLADGVLTIVLVNSALLGLNITAQQTIPLGIVALRPQT